MVNNGQYLRSTFISGTKLKSNIFENFAMFEMILLHHTELWPKIKSKNRKPVNIFAMRFLHNH